MTTQTFEELIKDEYYRERQDMCLMCDRICWLHNPFIYCPRLDEKDYKQDYTKKQDGPGNKKTDYRT